MCKPLYINVGASLDELDEWAQQASLDEWAQQASLDELAQEASLDEWAQQASLEYLVLALASVGMCMKIPYPPFRTP